LSEFSFAVDRFLSFLPDFEIAHALLFMDRAQSKASSKKKVVFQPNDLRLDPGPRTSLELAAQPIDMDITIPSTVHQSSRPLRKSKTTRTNGEKRRRKETLMSQNSKNIWTKHKRGLLFLVLFTVGWHGWETGPLAACVLLLSITGRPRSPMVMCVLLWPLGQATNEKTKYSSISNLHTIQPRSRSVRPACDPNRNGTHPTPSAPSHSFPHLSQLGVIYKHVQCMNGTLRG
jgi:hypothetical protein